jgi:hypothetical protein
MRCASDNPAQPPTGFLTTPRSDTLSVPRSLAIPIWYNSSMRTIEQWLLYKYIEGEFVLLSKPFKTKAQSEKARLKLPERDRRGVGVGVVGREGGAGSGSSFPLIKA